ncbi:hypothetical protein A2U01_0072661, partial [Trifolium medium]|nr:hypothetical protein [Trifolium medium]
MDVDTVLRRIMFDIIDSTDLTNLASSLIGPFVIRTAILDLGYPSLIAEVKK